MNVSAMSGGSDPGKSRPDIRPDRFQSWFFKPVGFLMAAAAGSLPFGQPCAQVCVTPAATLIAGFSAYAAVRLVPPASRNRAVAVAGYVFSMALSAALTWFGLQPPPAEQLLRKVGLEMPHSARNVRVAGRAGGIDPAYYVKMDLPLDAVNALRQGKQIRTNGWIDSGKRESPPLPSWWRPQEDGVSEFWGFDNPLPAMNVSFAYSPRSQILYIQLLHF